MEYRPFGRTGLNVSALGFGCWETSGRYGAFDESEVIAAVHRALDSGITCFDTAESYGFGNSERILAKALGGRRDEAIIVTKFGIRYPGREKRRDSRRERALSSIETSLKHLKTDYVDVYLVHSPDTNTPFEETMSALDEIVRSGKARFAGVSNFLPEQMMSCMETRPLDVAQHQYHMFDRTVEDEIFPVCREHGIGTTTWGSLAHGLLAGAFNAETTFDESDWRSQPKGRKSRFFTKENFATNLAVVDGLKGIAARHGKSVSQYGFELGAQQPRCECRLVGFRSPREVDESMGCMGWSLDQAERGRNRRPFPQVQDQDFGPKLVRGLIDSVLTVRGELQLLRYAAGIRLASVRSRCGRLMIAPGFQEFSSGSPHQIKDSYDAGLGYSCTVAREIVGAKLSSLPSDGIRRWRFLRRSRVTHIGNPSYSSKGEYFSYNFRKISTSRLTY